MLRKIFAVIVTFVLLASFIGVPVADASKPAPTYRVPDESRLFADYTGKELSLAELLALTPGKVPHALAQNANINVELILELAQPPLAALYVKAQETNAPMAPTAQQAYVSELRAAQAPIVSSVTAMGGLIFGQFTKAYNGIHVRVSAKDVARVSKLPGVVAVHSVTMYHADLANSVPFINADKVWTNPNLPLTGKNVRVAVIDTGVDFTHQALGGSGNPADYLTQINNSTIITGTVFNTKVEWGYDFAGTDYGTTGIPVPDPNPIDGAGHGTHVAATIAGLGSAATGKGVAPEATILGVKVFGDGGGTTGLVPEGIEWTLDPNQDGILDDHVNVINMSLGASYVPNDEADPEAVMVNYASAMGVVVVTSAGNSGDFEYATGFPGASDSALSVAASATGWLTGPTLGIQNTVVPTLTNIIYLPTGDGTPQVTSLMTGTLAYAANIPGSTNDLLCTVNIVNVAANALAGKIALISRGTCSFNEKINNAALLGAKAAIIFNSAAGGNTPPGMAISGTTIPAVGLGRSVGLNLATADGQIVVINSIDNPTSLPDPAVTPDSIASFSSRGPRGYDSKLKPEITAPGLNIYAASVSTGVGGVGMSGTSMASPHVAGVAALLRQAHPTWSSEMIKANLMNTTVDTMELVAPSTYVAGLDVAREGAGRVDAQAAAYASTLAIGDLKLVSLSWGFTEISGKAFNDTKYVRLINLSATDKVYTATVSSDTFSFSTGVTVTVQPTVAVQANKFVWVPVHLTVDSTKVGALLNAEQLEEYAGLVTFTNQANTADDARVPYYIVPRPYSNVVVTGISAPGASDATAMLASAGSIAPYAFSYVMPMMFNLPADRAMTPEGDLRAFGIDYFKYSGNDYLSMTYNTYGDWHIQQTYFIEFDTYFDTNQDGIWDYVSYNTNFGSATGGTRNNDFITVLFNLATSAGVIMPFSPYSDYNAGYMEQYIPTVSGLKLSNRGTVGGKYQFDYQVLSFDWLGNGKASPVKSYSYISDPLYIVDGGSQVDFGINNLQTFNLAQPAGVMFVDYNGKPGEGQVTTIDYTFGYWTQLFNPISMVSTTPTR